MNEQEANSWREIIPWEVRRYLDTIGAAKYMDLIGMAASNTYWDRTEHFWNYWTDVSCIASQLLKE